MEHIDLKFKAAPPAQTVAKIRSILMSIGLELQEDWHDSGIENCQSMTLRTNAGPMFFSNGKGVTKELARASAYGEFIERLQCGLHMYKYQSAVSDPALTLYTQAPDARYMTVAELEQEGDWMEHVIRAYPGLTRKRLAKHCAIYGCTSDRVLTLPYYSLFEDKYVYLPAGYVEHIYSANGCCAGNTREEAWLHALSEILERHNNYKVMEENLSVPTLSDEVLNQFPTVSKVIRKVREESDCDLEILDLSCGTGFPVIASRIISRTGHGYVVTVAADPVLEIAIERTLTELFQGRSLHDFLGSQTYELLEEMPISTMHNLINHLQTGNGMFGIDFFTEELSCSQESSQFRDNSGKATGELLTQTLELFRSMGLQVYVRNYSILGFPCYKFVVPGYSETHGMSLQQNIPEFALADEAAKILLAPEKASNVDLQLLLIYFQKAKSLRNLQLQYNKMAGLPLSQTLNHRLTYLTLSYANYRLGKKDESIRQLQLLCRSKWEDKELIGYFACVQRYLLHCDQLEPQKLRLLLTKFYHSRHVDALYERLEKGLTPYDGYLLRCTKPDCSQCVHRKLCAYDSATALIAKMGQYYRQFSHGQDRENFTF